MDPASVLTRVWQYKYWTLPVVLFCIAGAIYVMQYGPRSYETTMTYALIHPSTTVRENRPSTDNPYLRSPDQTLITAALVARLNTDAVAEELEHQGLGTDYRVTENSTGSGYLVDVTGVGLTKEEARSTTLFLGDYLARDLRALQQVNGAEDAYLFKAIVVATPGEPVEKFSSRLRALIAVLMASAVLMFGAVSLGQSVTELRGRRRDRRTNQAEVPSEPEAGSVNPSVRSRLDGLGLEVGQTPTGHGRPAAGTRADNPA